MHSEYQFTWKFAFQKEKFKYICLIYDRTGQKLFELVIFCFEFFYFRISLVIISHVVDWSAKENVEWNLAFSVWLCKIWLTALVFWLCVKLNLMYEKLWNYIAGRRPPFSCLILNFLWNFLNFQVSFDWLIVRSS